jgi:hypothetical protein
VKLIRSKILPVGLLVIVGAACSAAASDADGDAANGDAAAGDAAAATSDAGDEGVASDAAHDAGVAELRVLFIGNSYTYVNDLPGMLSRIAASSGAPPRIAVDSVTVGGGTLEQHLDAGVAPARIDEGIWTHVVLQDQSVEPMRVYFGDYNIYPGDAADAARTIGERVVDAGAIPVWYVTWAREASDVDGVYAAYKTNPTQMQDLLTSSYAKVALAVPGSVLACVGEAFRHSLAQHPGIVLHQADGSHPTVAGTYLAASTFYVALTGNEVPAASETPPGLSKEDAVSLREIARVGSTCAAFRAPARIRGFPQSSFVAGSPQRRFVLVENVGDSPAGLSDGQTLAAPFAWSSGTYPGYADTRLSPDAPPCGSQLAPWSGCTLAVTFSGAEAGAGTLTLGLTGAYEPALAIPLSGETTEQPVLELHRDPGSTGPDPRGFGWMPPSASVSARQGETAVFHFFVTNVGGSSAAALAGYQLGTLPFSSPPWSWGTTADPDAGFPGGNGSITLEGNTWPHCSDVLEAGQTCVVTGAFTPQEPPPNGEYHSRALRIHANDAGVMPLARTSLYGYVLDAGP